MSVHNIDEYVSLTNSLGRSFSPNNEIEDLRREVRRQREILDVMLPGYMRLKESFGDMERRMETIETRIETIEDDLQGGDEKTTKLGRAFVEINQKFGDGFKSQFKKNSSIDRYLYGLRNSLEELKERFEARHDPIVAETHLDVLMKYDESSLKQDEVSEALVDNGKRHAEVEYDWDDDAEQPPSHAETVPTMVEVIRQPPSSQEMPPPSPPLPPPPPAFEMPPLPPPPPPPPPQPLPTVQVEPPTPVTSQDDAQAAASLMLEVPKPAEGQEDVGEDSAEVPAGTTLQRRSRSPIDTANQRRSPRNHSRTPSPSPSTIPQKRRTESSDEPAAKRGKKQ